jgi:hypothetical protein
MELSISSIHEDAKTVFGEVVFSYMPDAVETMTAQLSKFDVGGDRHGRFCVLYNTHLSKNGANLKTLYIKVSGKLFRSP